MNLLDFFFEQLVQESDMDTIQSNAQDADHAQMVDQSYTGVMQGFAVTEAPVPDLTVDIEAGVGYDKEGQRLESLVAVNLDLSVDSNNQQTAVGLVGNAKWISVFVQFDRAESDQRFDGNGTPVLFRQDESISFVVVQGAEALNPSKPALLSDAILIADVIIKFGTIAIVDGVNETVVPRIESKDVVVQFNSRFEFTFNLTATTPATIQEGELPVALQAILTELNDHIAELGNPHDASSIAFDNSGIPATWVNMNAAVEVQAALDGIQDDLGDASAGSAQGSRRIGYDSSSQWADSTSLSSSDVGNAVQEIVDVLADSTGGDGAGRIGYEDAIFDVRYGSVDSVGDALDDLANRAARIDAVETISAAWVHSSTLSTTGQFNASGPALFSGEHRVQGVDIAGVGTTFERTAGSTLARDEDHIVNVVHTLTLGSSSVFIPLEDFGSPSGADLLTSIRGRIVIWDDSTAGDPNVTMLTFDFIGGIQNASSNAAISAGLDAARTLSGGTTNFTSVVIGAPAGTGEVGLTVTFATNDGAVRNITVIWQTYRVLEDAVA